MSNWRYECPNGHVTIRTRGNSVHSDTETPYIDCKTCRTQGENFKYKYKIDKKTGEKIEA